MRNTLFYALKPAIPRAVQLGLRRHLIRRRIDQVRSIWPVLPGSEVTPSNWPGWPDGKRFALVLTHDVEGSRGVERVESVMDLESRYGLRSSFNFVPERYDTPPALRQHLVENGFEVGVHGLRHDGKLFRSRENFLRRAPRINRYLQDWQATGFRSPAMHSNLEWLHDLDIAYDMSTFDTDPFEPQPDGVGTIFPFWVPGPSGRPGYAELPYTLPQDFTLFVLMGDTTIDRLRSKLDWVVQHGGMALINVHPDYLQFENHPDHPECFPAQLYAEFLEDVLARYRGEFWMALPGELAAHVERHRPMHARANIYPSVPVENLA